MILVWTESGGSYTIDPANLRVRKTRSSEGSSVSTFGWMKYAELRSSPAEGVPYLPIEPDSIELGDCLFFVAWNRWVRTSPVSQILRNHPAGSAMTMKEND
jgi:hypothetical protein